jgi:spore coat protein JB
MENNSSACGDSYGTMPPCAPLAVPYVPFQQTGSKKYDQAEALNNGTLFPGLNLPFQAKATAADVASSGPLAELQALEFVILELGLYLDTHQGDQEAFALFQQYTALEKEGRARYESMYGPLTQAATASADSYTWLKDPWPWNVQEGGTK